MNKKKAEQSKAIEASHTQYPQGSAESLIAQAIAKGTPVATMERLLAMRRELKSEYAKEAYDRDMAAFQSECPPIQKTKSVETRAGKKAYSYAPIEVLDAETKDLRKKYGFSYSSNMYIVDNNVKVILKVTHRDGHSELNEVTVPLGNKTDVMSNSQVTVAAATFAKRHAFKNAFGITEIDEDDESVLKKGDVEAGKLPKDIIEKINKIETHEELVKFCKETKEKHPDFYSALQVEYGRRKDEITQVVEGTVVEDADKAINGGKDK